jgi:hypothetical protein
LNKLGEWSLLWLPAVSENVAAKFREEAEQCRRQAEGAISPLDRESWLKMAGEWIKLAQDAELRTKSGPTLTS